MLRELLLPAQAVLPLLLCERRACPCAFNTASARDIHSPARSKSKPAMALCPNPGSLSTSHGNFRFSPTSRGAMLHLMRLQHLAACVAASLELRSSYKLASQASGEAAHTREEDLNKAGGCKRHLELSWPPLPKLGARTLPTHLDWLCHVGIGEM